MGISVSPPPGSAPSVVKIEKKTITAGRVITWNTSLGTYTKYEIYFTGIWTGVAAPGINLKVNAEAEFSSGVSAANANVAPSSTTVVIYNLPGVVHNCVTKHCNVSTGLTTEATKNSTISAAITSITVDLDNTVAGTYDGIAVLYGYV
jgi:hypothetical protein